MNRENNNSENGAIMVEAAIYFPITIGIVMVVLYFGLFKLQESYFFFQVERAATELAREVSYPGYDSFTDENPLKNRRWILTGKTVRRNHRRNLIMLHIKAVLRRFIDGEWTVSLPDGQQITSRRFRKTAHCFPWGAPKPM